MEDSNATPNQKSRWQNRRKMAWIALMSILIVTILIFQWHLLWVLMLDLLHLIKKFS